MTSPLIASGTRPGVSPAKGLMAPGLKALSMPPLTQTAPLVRNQSSFQNFGAPGQPQLKAPLQADTLEKAHGVPLGAKPAESPSSASPQAPAKEKVFYPSPRDILRNSGAQYREEIHHAMEELYGPGRYLPETEHPVRKRRRPAASHAHHAAASAHH